MSRFFDTFFWDGKVEKSADGVFSQFFEFKPSDNALILASLLPIVEIREMVVDDYEVNTKFKKENVEIALKFYKEIFTKIQEEQMMVDLSKYYEVEASDINLIHVGSAIAEHIKREFSLEKTKFGSKQPFLQFQALNKSFDGEEFIHIKAIPGPDIFGCAAKEKIFFDIFHLNSSELLKDLTIFRFDLCMFHDKPYLV